MASVDPAAVERAAKAICSYGDDPPEWESMDEHWKQSWRDLAEVGLLAASSEREEGR